MTGPEQAREDLAEILSDGRLEMGEAISRMGELGHPAGRVDRARRALEVETVRTGPPGSKQVFYWELPGTCPTCMRPFGPDVAPTPAPWGRNGGTISDYYSDESRPIEPPSPPPEVQPAPPPQPPLRDFRAPRCNVCGKASALEPGSPCPYWGRIGQRCRGRMQ
jgi:hypothetical protein